jgi:protein-S-isoprenylcysteine O-methyltransferase Ste14
MSEKSIVREIYRWRVRAGYICIILAIILARPNRYSLLAGAGLCVSGLLLRAWASGHLMKEKELACSGPYRFTRNPLYLGNLIIGTSVVVASYSWWMVGIFFIYFLLFYPVVLRREAERMRTLFPKEYEKYKSKVPLFFPSFRQSFFPNNAKFSRKLYKRNKEYRALLGAALFWLAITAKMLLIL